MRSVGLQNPGFQGLKIHCDHVFQSTQMFTGCLIFNALFLDFFS